MDNLEISARTVEDATKKALAQLNTTIDQVEITVIHEGRGGILGLGAEDARISVRILTPPSGENDEVINIAREVLETILAKMGVQASISFNPPDKAFTSEDETRAITFNIEGDDLGTLIGRRGITIDALQYLVRLITARRTKSKIPIMIDVQAYKQKRYDDLRTLAMNVASQVKTRKSSFRLEPMSAFERRIIHLTLADDPDVTTESVGEGDMRKVVVSPKTR